MFLQFSCVIHFAAPGKTNMAKLEGLRALGTECKINLTLWVLCLDQCLNKVITPLSPKKQLYLKYNPSAVCMGQLSKGHHV